MRVFLYTDNLDYYDKIYDCDENAFRFEILSRKNSTAVIKFAFVNDRDDAEQLKGTPFYVKKEDLPKLDEGQFFICDLIGQKVSVIGEDIDLKIIDVKNFGAGDLIEISEKESDNSFFIPFTKENFPESNGEIFITSETYKNFKN